MEHYIDAALEQKHLEWEVLELRAIRRPIGRPDGLDFQRDTDESRVRDMVANYDPLAAGPIFVFFWKGDYWDYEGGHSLVMHRRLGHQTWMCRVAYGYTPQEVAKAFGLQSKRRRSVGTKDTLRAMRAAGAPEYVEATRIVEKYGYVLDTSRKGEARHDGVPLKAHGEVITIARQPGGFAILDKSLAVLTEAWGATPFMAAMLGGTAQFIRKWLTRAPSPEHEKDFFIRNMVEIARSNSEAAFLRTGQSVMDTNVRNNTLIEAAWLTLYNRRRTTYALREKKDDA